MGHYTLLGPTLKPHLHALKNRHGTQKFFATVLTILRHGTPNFRRVNVSVPNVVWHQCSKFYGCRDYLPEEVPRLPPGGSLGTGKRGTVPKIWRAVPIFLARVNGVFKRNQINKNETTQTKRYHANKKENTQIRKKPRK